MQLWTDALKEHFPSFPVPGPEPTGQPDVDVQSDQSARMRHQRNAVAVGQVDNYLGVAPMGDICERLIRDGARTDIMTSTRPPRGSVFLVEDEVMIRMMVADMLDELGYTVVAEAGEIDEAMRLAQTTYFDLAILDVNVNGKVISPVADVIKAQNRPFIFATGYGSSGLPEEYRDRPALQKPFQLETLGRMIDTALRGTAA
jgi:CheY-like chemotaxis protein